MVQGLCDLFDVSDSRKRALLHGLGLLQNEFLDNAKLKTFDGLLQSARVHCLSKIELYFLHDASQLKAPLNLRNEAAAVSLLLAFFADASGSGGGDAGGGSSSSSNSGEAGSQQEAAQMLAELGSYSERLWPELASGDMALSSSSSDGSGDCSGGADGSTAEVQQQGQQQQQQQQQKQHQDQQKQQRQQQQQPPRGVTAPPGSAAADFEGWAREQGVKGAITIASFGSLRGCAATSDVQPGDTLLSIPSDVLIYEDTVKQTDLGRMLHAIPGLTIDNLLVCFTMIDRHDVDSKWALYWRSLPAKYYTGLSFPPELVSQLGGTAAQLELTRAQAHLQQQYTATRPLFDMLLQAYPQYLQPEWFDYESYLWAAELWYSYAFEVEFPAGDDGEEEAGGTQPAMQLASSSGSGSRGKGSGAAPPAKSRNAAGSGRAPRGRRTGGDSAGGRAGGKPGPANGGTGHSGSGSGSSSSSKPVMVPFGCNLNHSPWPHCVRYGRVNPATRTLDYPAFRPCPEGQQVFISYGPVPNLKLLCYYGFVIPSNPHDLVPLQLEVPEGPLKQQQLAALEALGMSLEHSLQAGPLSVQLLACLRVIVATSAELQLIRKGRADPLAGTVNAENEEQALATLEAALEGMLGPLEELSLLAGGGGAGGDAGGVAGGEAGGGADGEAGQQMESLRLEQQQHQQEEEEQQQQEGAVGTEPAGLSEGGNGAARPESTPTPALLLPVPQQQPHQGESKINENGFDGDWRMSRHFCRVYLQGQRHILRRSLQECRSLRAELAAADAPS